MFRRSRYADVIATQLDLFAEGDELDDVESALARYNAADRDEAESLYGDYQLAIEAAADGLAELRDTYAARLEDAARYVVDFNRAAAKRWPALAAAIEAS